MSHATQPEPATPGRAGRGRSRRWPKRRWLVPASVAAVVVVGAAVSPAGAEGRGSGRGAGGNPHNEFVQTNLVTSLATGAQITGDQDLLNPWGVAMTPGSPLWVSDNNSGLATLYSISPGGMSATKVTRLKVTVPGGRASTNDTSSPTGQVYNPTPGFVVTTPAGTGSALFIFDSESGQISGWNPMADPPGTSGQATGTLKFSSPTAVYKGLAIATDSDGTFLYAANFHDNSVDVFNDSWMPAHLAGDFTDPHLPPGYAPFGIQVLNDLLYVTYAKQNAAGHDDVAGPGHGFVDVYTLNGFLVERLASRGALNSPWGLEIAPKTGFGPFGGKLLVGNFGDGRINVFDPFKPDHFLGQLRDERGRPITIDDLWSLRFGTTATGGTTTLLFTAGIQDESQGLLGSINAAP